jgi:hypothetical protein
VVQSVLRRVSGGDWGEFFVGEEGVRGGYGPAIGSANHPNLCPPRLSVPPSVIASR